MDTLNVVVVRFPVKPILRIVTPPARFGGSSGIASIAIRQETTPGPRYRRRFPSFTSNERLRQPTTDPGRSGWLHSERVCSIGKREFGIDSKPRQNSQS